MARGLAVAAVALCCLVVVAPAGAASGTYTCATLQAGLNQAGNTDTITLDDANLCTANYTLPNFDTPTGIQNYKSWTLTGTAGSGFSPTSGRALTAPTCTGSSSRT